MRRNSCDNDDGGFLVKGAFDTGIIPASGAGTRLMWYPGKGAYRAGGVLITKWDDAHIGGYSTATGYRTRAIGSHSTATGLNTTASGNYSTAMGLNTTARAYGSLVIGKSNVPGWTGNEADLFTYPTDSADLLALRRLELDQDPIRHSRARRSTLRRFPLRPRLCLSQRRAILLCRKGFPRLGAGAGGGAVYERVVADPGLAEVFSGYRIDTGPPGGTYLGR